MDQGQQWYAANATLWIPLQSIAFLSERQTSISVDREGRLHAEHGPAWAWADGFTIYALDGIRVPAWVVEGPPDPHRILNELENAEQRRVAFNHIGWEFAISALQLQVLDTHQNPHMGTLYALPPSLSRGQANLLLARNGSPHPDGEYQMYGLLCSAEARTVLEAQASLAQLSPDEFALLEGRS